MPHARLIQRHDQCAQLERHINAETLSQVRRLNVRFEDGHYSIHGAAPSYYVRQLAEQAALELVAWNELELDIDVEAYDAGHAPTTGYSRPRHAELVLS